MRKKEKENRFFTPFSNQTLFPQDMNEYGFALGRGVRYQKECQNQTGENDCHDDSAP